MTGKQQRQCPFCSLAEEQIVLENPLAVVKRDGYPISSGHALVIPRRHVVSFFDTTTDERVAILELLARAKSLVDHEHAPDGYNIGINDGAAAGQTVMHLHVHLIPRYLGDVADPRGGIRGIFPDKAAYWKNQ